MSETIMSTLENVAYHEAGHAVVAAVQGRQIGRILVEEDGNDWRGKFKHARNAKDDPPNPVSEAERLMAGELAVRKHLRLPLKIEKTTGDDRGDGDRAWSIANNERSYDPKSWFRTAEKKAVMTLERNWDAVEALAEKVQSQRYVSGEDVLNAIKQAGLKVADPSRQPAVLPEDD